MIQSAFNGMCMAIADSVPGVSGGTIAFILGFYDEFIDSLHSMVSKDNARRKKAILFLLKLGIGWAFGMVACVLLLSKLFTANIYLMSSVFLGLTTASIPFVISAEKATLQGKAKDIPFAVIGTVVVVAISLLRDNAEALGAIDFLHLTPIHFTYILVSGMVAITAMVLPGISGSTVLLIAGVYLPTINAVKEFLHLNFAVFPGLCALGIGVLLGVGLSIHFIKAALEKHRSKMVYLIIGLMIGSLFAIVMGPTTLDEPLPHLDLSTFNIIGFIVGIGILFGLEFIKNKLSQK